MNLLKKIVWSHYDLIKYLANPKYHHIHIDQLKYLGEITGNNVLLKNIQHIFQFQKIIPLGVYYRLFLYTHRFLVIITCLNLIIVAIVCIIIKRNRKLKSIYEMCSYNISAFSF